MLAVGLGYIGHLGLRTVFFSILFTTRVFLFYLWLLKSRYNNTGPV